MNDLGLLLQKASKDWKEGVQSVMDPLGLTLPSYLLLSAVYTFQFDEGRSPSQSEAATSVGLDLNVTAQTMKYLVAHRLMNREVNEHDSRAYTLSLTLAGEQLAKTAQLAVSRFEKDFFSTIKPVDFAEALATLTNKPV